jgi:lipooligosaccharide transport system permease protein
MVVMHLTSATHAVAMFPATILVGCAFGGLGLATSTVIRSWQEFDLIASAQFALFLFSGTFVPPSAYPVVVRWLVELSPLYRSVDLVRGLSAGSAGRSQLIDVLYLLALLVAGLAVAGRRMTTLLCR